MKLRKKKSIKNPSFFTPSTSQHLCPWKSGWEAKRSLASSLLRPGLHRFRTTRIVFSPFGVPVVVTILCSTLRPYSFSNQPGRIGLTCKPPSPNFNRFAIKASGAQTRWPDELSKQTGLHSLDAEPWILELFWIEFVQHLECIWISRTASTWCQTLCLPRGQSHGLSIQWIWCSLFLILGE